jgi:hypothetical protein
MIFSCFDRHDLSHVLRSHGFRRHSSSAGCAKRQQKELSLNRLPNATFGFYWVTFMILSFSLNPHRI